MGEDGSLVLCRYEALDVVPLPGIRAASAIAGDSCGAAVGRLAVAVRGSGGKAKLMVFSVALGVKGQGQGVQLLAQVPLQDPVSELAWVGNSIVCAVPGGYTLVQSGNKVTEVARGLTVPPRLSSLPASRLGALAFSEALLLLTDASGSAVREPLLIPGRPLTITHSGHFLVIVSEDSGLTVFDVHTAKPVQSIPFAHDDPWVAASGRLPSCADSAMPLDLDSGRGSVVTGGAVGVGHVLLATASTLFCLQPVELEEQVRELLKSARYEDALAIITACLDSGESWAGTALAQTGLLQLQDLRIPAALETLLRCSRLVFQPCQLLPLFPEAAAKWLHSVPRPPYWSLHQPLQGLQLMAENALEQSQPDTYASDASRHSISAPSSPFHNSPCGSRGGPPASPGSKSPAPHGLSHQLRQTHDSGNGVEDSVYEVVRDAQRRIVDYLLQARNTRGPSSPGSPALPALACRDGMDTLIALLLCELGGAARLEAFVADPRHACEMSLVTPSLEAAGRFHALALLRAARGGAAQALDVWQRMAAGALQESVGVTSGAVHDAGGDAAAVAAQSASSLMSDPVPVPPLLCLSKLTWLLAQSASHALHVLRSRSLPIPEVLSLLADRTDDVRWQYLHHLVYGGLQAMALSSSSTNNSSSSTNNNNNSSSGRGHQGGVGTVSVGSLNESPADCEGGDCGVGAVGGEDVRELHTELALELVECVLAAQAACVRTIKAGSSSSSSSRANDCVQHQHMPASEPSAASSVASDPTASATATDFPALRPSYDFSLQHVPASPMRPVPRGQSPLHPQTPHQQQLQTQLSLPPLPAPSHQSTSNPRPPGSQGMGTSALNSSSNGSGGSGRGPSASTSSPPNHLHSQHHQQHPSPPPTSPPFQPSSPFATAPSHDTSLHRAQGPTATRLMRGPSSSSSSSAAATAAPLTSLSMLHHIASCTLSHASDPASATPYYTLQQQQQHARQHPALPPTSGAPEGAGDAGAATAADAEAAATAAAAAAAGAALHADACRLQQQRAALQLHLQLSPLYDAGVVLQAVAGAPLLGREAVLLHCRLGQHAEALGVLALVLQDVEGAVFYCKVHAGQQGYLQLLDLFLRPGDGRPPMYAAACRVLSAEGASLNPMALLQALGDDMPLHLACSTLSNVLSSVLHRKRFGQVVKSLTRAQNLSVRTERAELLGRSVVIAEDSLCRGCHKPLGDRVFYRYPSGMLLCNSCVSCHQGQTSPS
ncbi:MAG: hypothetical protein WDW36_003149 [Sanguina aurantia]